MIALVTRIPDEAEQLWLEALSLRMPDEKIVSFRHLEEDDRAAVDIAIVANPDPMDLARLPGVKWIHSLWAGVERLVSEIGDNTLPVVRLVDPQLSRTMAEAVLAWTYYLFRDMPAYARFQRERSWQQLPYRRPDQITIGLLGLGALGEAAAHRLSDAGFKVIGWSRSAKNIEGIETHSGDDGLNTVLRRSDILVCLLPLTSATRELLNAEKLALLPANASLINFARGPIVVSEDLLQALDTGRLSHAVLDVFDVEPLPADAPFWTHPQITVLPHISAPTDRETAAAIVADNIRTFRRTAKLPSIVDFGRGY